jgi:hypothetical protein
MKLYADVVERKAHYTDRQFRALIEVFAMAQRSPTWGCLPPRPALEAKIGKATTAFLFAEGDLIEDTDNGVTTVTVAGWSHYQARSVDLTNAERQRRFRARHKPDNGSVTPVTSSASDNGRGPRARDPLLKEIAEAIETTYGPEERYTPGLTPARSAT